MIPLPKEISFVFSANDKGGNPKRPDYRGEVTIPGSKYKLAVWKRKRGGTGPEFFSGKLTLDEGPTQEAPKEEAKAEESKPLPTSKPAIDEDEPF